MQMINPFQWQIDHKGYAVIDGALATELQNRGCDLNDALWSAKILIEQPHLISAVHYDYFNAGADCAITASYQATPLGFAKRGLSPLEAIELIKRSVILAQRAKTIYLQQHATSRPLVIAGSVGPYGAYLADGSEYTGNYALSDQEMTLFHIDRINTLIEAGVDILACETMPSFTEIKVLIDIIKQYPTMPCWVSFTLKDSQHLSDGTPLKHVIEWLNTIDQVIFMGVNCIALDKVTSALKTFNQFTAKPLVVYPNSGELYDANTKTWSVNDHHLTLSNQVREWQENGAKLIGGCCRTTPEDIRRLVEELNR
ncbi:homocysteine S-methyltransferase [Frischella sp. Ac13]|uniref:Homocysteine S-methyltransferase n=1 Tax=Frischella japonica TaxID=2741544 RepID=A0ABR7QWL7_9GAMM|nr:homocysteine S-methyltransferase [Frischella japonica]MBC9130520.1 homocysteine S-methyltransferase [Frischella japonica]